MINLLRPDITPTSLERPAVKSYLASLSRHLDAPDLVPHPGEGPQVRSNDLLEVFEVHFFAKCYLTEEWLGSIYRLEVDHFRPENEFPLLKYDWPNLFPITHWANQQRPKSYPKGGLLNPCDPADDVENEIVYLIGFGGAEISFSYRDPNSKKAANTARLLDRLHNGYDNNSRRSSHGLRIAIQKRMIEVESAILDWQSSDSNTSDGIEKEGILKDLLSRKSPFTMLMRAIPAVQDNVPSSFLD